MLSCNKIAYCKLSFKHIGEIDFIKDLVLPITYNPVLDETLDIAQITLTNLKQADYPLVDISKAFEAFSLVRIGFVGQTTEIRLVIAHDNCESKRKGANWQSWNHTIQLVEETKILERESVDVLTFNNPIKRNYDLEGTVEWFVFDTSNSSKLVFIPFFSPGSDAETNGWEPPHGVKMCHVKGSRFSISDNLEGFIYNTTDDLRSLVLTVQTPRGRTKKYSSLKKMKNGSYVSSTIAEFDFGEQGEYTLTFCLTYEHMTGDWITEKYVTYVRAYLVVLSENAEINNYKISDTLNRVLDLTPLRTAEETQKYKFDVTQLSEFEKEESPEFAFTGHTLFETMLLIASYKGAFPKMHTDNSDNKIISFRPLWNGVWITESDLKAHCIKEINSSDINQYCTYFETEVQNLVGLNDSRKATMIDPYAGGYKTTRSGSATEISEDTVMISTDQNIYQSINLIMGYTDGVEIGNITDYVYEEGEYNGLSNLAAAYPYSKSYALKWAQMEKGYSNLAYRANHASKLENAFERPAISNILEKMGGNKLKEGLISYLNELINPSENHDSFADLLFRSEYVPIFNARVKQYKDYFGEFHHDGSIKYNQTAELVDSEMYGEHLKQLIRKMGNATKRCVYIFDKIDDVPEVGTVVDGYSIYDVQMSIRENEVVATISYVKYAELSQYIGVKNAWKDSDVSIDKYYNRAISYNEFLLFTHDEEKQSTSKAVTLSSLYLLMNFIMPAALTCVEATGYAEDGSSLNTVLLPVVSLAMGNSIFFQWQYADNYSAGNMSEEAPTGATNAISGTKYNRAQKAVKYCDMYGRLETYDFKLMISGPLADSESLIWVENADEDWSPQIIDYPGTVDLGVSMNVFVTIKLSKAYPVAVTVKFAVTYKSGAIREFTEIISAGQTNCTSSKIVNLIEAVSLISATCMDMTDQECYYSQQDLKRLIGYSLPLKPAELRRTSDLTEWQGASVIAVDKLLVEKNSSEALTFSVQLHYCSDNENFIVGSGLTNYCSLIGGQCDEVKLYGFTERLNIFKRRLEIESMEKNGKAVSLGELDPNVNEDKNRIEINLPNTINQYNAWAFIGKKKTQDSEDDNVVYTYQIIFGENRDLKGSDFKTELYLLPMHKLEDFI